MTKNQNFKSSSIIIGQTSEFDYSNTQVFQSLLEIETTVFMGCLPILRSKNIDVVNVTNLNDTYE